MGQPYEKDRREGEKEQRKGKEKGGNRPSLRGSITSPSGSRKYDVALWPARSRKGSRYLRGSVKITTPDGDVQRWRIVLFYNSGPSSTGEGGRKGEEKEEGEEEGEEYFEE